MRCRTSIAALTALTLALALLVPALAHAQEGMANPAPFRVTITNLTRGQIFGPPMVVTHTRHWKLFEVGQPASPGVAAMAEDADLSLLMNDFASNPEVLDVAVASGPLMPGASVTLEVDSLFPADRITVAQMLVTTNDAFFALNDVAGPRGPVKSETHYVPAYDSGSEVNSESCATIPGPPCGNGGVRDTVGAEGYVYIHPGIHGVGDLDAATLDWRNPVAKVSITRLPMRR